MGLGRGAILLVVALLINVWFFTIPTEFRRTRLCTDADTAMYPDVCMTTGQFTKGIADYYINGTYIDRSCSTWWWE
jgi:hypothetical protein